MFNRCDKLFAPGDPADMAPVFSSGDTHPAEGLKFWDKKVYLSRYNHSQQPGRSFAKIPEPTF
jgi:hypothetical protein